jgi:hypothetical protein
LAEWEEIEQVTGYEGVFREIFKILPEEFKKSLASLVVKNFCLVDSIVSRTDKTKREYAFSLCYDKSKKSIEPSSVKEGTERLVETPKCPPKSELVGVVHTHPGEHHPEPSTGDVLNDFELGLVVSCVASKGKWPWEPDVAVNCSCYDITHPEYEHYRRKLSEIREKYFSVMQKIDKYVGEGKLVPDEILKEYYAVRDKIKKIYEEAISKGIVTKGCYGTRIEDGILSRKNVEDEIRYRDWLRRLENI